MSGIFKQEIDNNQEVGVDRLPSKLLSEISRYQENVNAFFSQAHQVLRVPTQGMGQSEDSHNFHS